MAGRATIDGELLAAWLKWQRESARIVRRYRNLQYRLPAMSEETLKTLQINRP